MVGFESRGYRNDGGSTHGRTDEFCGDYLGAVSSGGLVVLSNFTDRSVDVDQ